MIIFPETYLASRDAFRSCLPSVQEIWSTAVLNQHTLTADSDLSIDWLSAAALKEKKNIVIFSTAEHGIEGYVGAGMLQVFMEEFLSQLNPDNTGLLLIHAINPWGMANFQRYNPHLVDLNRNFLKAGEFNPAFNPDYDLLRPLLEPQGKIHSVWGETLKLGVNMARAMLRHGVSAIREGMLKGQYRHPQGVYFGGTEPQQETEVLMKLLKEAIDEYQNIIHVDMHTGYGPRYQMSLVCSPKEKLSSAELVEKLNYPLVVKTNPGEFYTIQGDMVDFDYQVREEKSTDTRLFAVAFEFGTFGSSLLSQMRSLRAEVMNSQLWRSGAGSAQVANQVRAEYKELFYPQEKRWREKALQDGRQAIAGILKAFILE